MAELLLYMTGVKKREKEREGGKTPRGASASRFYDE